MIRVVIHVGVVRFHEDGSEDAQDGYCDEHALSHELYDFCERHFTSSLFIKSQTSGLSSIIQYLYLPR